MKPYVVLLRGINVSGQKLIKMAELKELCHSINLQQVSTYIQSGNIVFTSNQEPSEIKKLLENAIHNKYGFHVETFVISIEHLKTISENHPQISEIETQRKAIYFTFLNEMANKHLVSELASLEQQNEFFQITNQVIYCFYPNGYGRSKWNNVFFEKKLKVACTTRNYNTITKLIEMCSTLE